MRPDAPEVDWNKGPGRGSEAEGNFRSYSHAEISYLDRCGDPNVDANLGAAGDDSGVVTDPTDAVIPGVGVTITNRGTGIAAKAETNEQGFYSVPGLVPGGYRVEVTAQGFAPAAANLTLNVGQTARLDLTLRVGTVGKAVEVSSAAAMIDSETSTVGQVIDNKRIVELPLNGRNYLDLAQLTTGVAPSSGSRTTSKGSFSALGMRSYQTNVLLDGIDNNSRASGGQLGFEA